jgi:hypothetical protein
LINFVLTVVKAKGLAFVKVVVVALIALLIYWVEGYLVFIFYIILEFV